MCLRWHDEEQEGKDLTKFLSQISSQSVLKLGGENVENLQDRIQANGNNLKKSNFRDLILSKDEMGLFLLVFLVQIIMFKPFLLFVTNS